MGSIPGSRQSPGEGNGNPLQYSYLENPMDRGAWQATLHGVANSRPWLSDGVCAHVRAHTHVPRCGLHSMELGTVGRDLATECVCTCTHPQPLCHEWIEVCLCKDVQHSRRWAGGKGAKLYLWFLISPYHSHYCLNPSPLPPWKNGLPLNWSLVPKRLGSAAWDFISWSLDENREEKTLRNFWIICRDNSFIALNNWV